MDFAVRSVGSADSLAALALVRALLNCLARDGVLSDDAIRTIVTDALNQLNTPSIERFEEARGLVTSVRT